MGVDTKVNIVREFFWKRYEAIIDFLSACGGHLGFLLPVTLGLPWLIL